jgi:hypothetical protein
MQSESLKSGMVQDAFAISTQPGLYMIDPVFTSPRPGGCVENPTVTCSVSNARDVGAESLLFGLDRPLERYVLPAPPMESMDLPDNEADGRGLPSTEFRARGSQRGQAHAWGLVDEMPYHDPQCVSRLVFQEPTRGGLGTRMMARDAACQ